MDLNLNENVQRLSHSRYQNMFASSSDASLEQSLGKNVYILYLNRNLNLPVKMKVNNAISKF
jgi:hypothetical protein